MLRKDNLDGGPLIGASEDARPTGQPPPTELVCHVRDDAEPLNDGPHLLLSPCMDRTPVIYVARLPSAVTRVGSMPLERLVLRSGDRRLSPLPRPDERALAEKTNLVAARGGHDVDVKVGGAEWERGGQGEGV